MKAALKSSDGIQISEVESRAPGADEIRVRADACGICGTDLHFPVPGTSPGRFGHEIAGTVIETGNNVDDVVVGQQVALDSATPCGRCHNCRNSNQELCKNLRSIFLTNDLGFAEEVTAPAISANPFQQSSPEAVCSQEPLGVAIDMVRLTEIEPMSNVLVMGAGPIGLMAVVLAKRQGAENVFVCQRARRKKRRELAVEWGADGVLDPSELENADFGCAIDRIMITTPPNTIATAADLATKGAILTFIGLGQGESGQIQLDGDAFHFKKLQLRASFASPALFGPRAVEYIEKGIIDAEALVSHQYPLEQLPQAMETATKDPEAVKVVISNQRSES